MNLRWITLISFTIIAIAVWIIVGLTQDKTPEYLQNTYANYLTPISAELNEKALQEIVVREGETLLIERDALE